MFRNKLHIFPSINFGILSIVLAAIVFYGCGNSSNAHSQPAKPSADKNTWTVAPSAQSAPTLVDRVIDAVKSDSDAIVIDDRHNSRSNSDIWHHDDSGTLRNDPLYRRANDLIKQQNFSEAKRVLQQLVDSGTGANSSSVWRRLGDCYYNLLELSSAISVYEKSLALNRENYFSMRGLAFAYLYKGHDYWNARERAKAHTEYAQALKLLQQCMRIYPGDLEAMYGRAMAAEGASRRLYQNALALLGSGDKEKAAAAARNCGEVISEGIESARQRVAKMDKEIGSRSVLGGLLQRQALLNYQFSFHDNALQNIGLAIKAYEAITKISPDNVLAQKELNKCKEFQKKWEGEQLAGG